MKRSKVWISLCALLCTCGQVLAADRPPNIVFLLADDLGYGDVGFCGRREWSTPNIDQLAQQGTIFRRWYAASVVCAPSRAAFLTGRYGIHNGVTGNSDHLDLSEVTIAEALKAHGYATGLFGKWHLCPGRGDAPGFPLDQGFDEFFGFIGGKEAWEKFPKKLWFGREKKSVDGYADNLFADHAIDFIKKQHDADKPFFVYLAFTASHGLVQGPPDEVAKFKGKFAEKDTKEIHEPYANYAAMVTNLDKQIARVLQVLDELKLTQDTLVVFTSDQGATFEKLAAGATDYFDSNAPFRGQKRTLWEGGTRVPAAVRWPGHVPAGKESHEIVHMTDLFPTFLSAASGSVDPSWKLDGLNLLDVWLGKSAAPKRTLFWEWRSEGDTQTAAMRGDLKLVITGGNKPELFDVERDPTERRNIRAEHPKIAEDLESQIKAWLATERKVPATRTAGRSSDE
jgi:arylsulfatase A-like enzyme